MKKTTTKTITRTIEETTTYCDHCKENLHADRGRFWDEEVEIKVKGGRTFGPDGGESTIYEVHICFKCFEKKLLPVLEEAGFPVHMREVDW